MKIPNINFHRTPSSARPTDICGQTDEWTDEHDEASRCFLQLGERAGK